MKKVRVLYANKLELRIVMFDVSSPRFLEADLVVCEDEIMELFEGSGIDGQIMYR